MFAILQSADNLLAYFESNDAHVQGVSDGGDTTCASANNCFCVDCDGGYARDAALIANAAI